MFKTPETERKYNERLNRYVTAMNGGTPDRIPIRFFFQEAAAKYCGYTNQQVGCDYNSAFEATRKMAEDVNTDAVMLNAIWSNYGVGKSLGLKYFHVPGVDVGMESVLQYSEPEAEEDLFMQADEYDEFIYDPTAFILSKWFPRASGALVKTGSPVTNAHNLALISGGMAYANYMNAFGPASAKLMYESGIVGANSGMIKAPFDLLADKFRGYMGLIEDCYENPDKVIKACEALMPHIVANALACADPTKNVPITLWAHRGCIPFINMEMFENIYFATLKPVLEEITGKGHQVLFYSEGNWEPHYDAFMTLKENTLIYHLDHADFRKALKLKEKFALSGGVDYNLLVRGTRDELKSHLAEIFDTVGRDGGYILDASALMLSDVDPENIKFVADYTMEHGVYSQGHNSGRPKAIFDAPKTESVTGNPPNVCRPWEEISKPYKNLTGDVELVKNSWQAVDAMAYNYLWTTVLW